MALLFKNKYRIPSARLKGWDYASEGCYFVTINTKYGKHYFGEIIKRAFTDPEINNPSWSDHFVLKPTEIGEVAISEWFKAAEMRPEMNIRLGEFIVMPNHIHGIIIIGKNEYNSSKLERKIGEPGPQSNNLASMIRGYKSAVTTYARKHNIEFNWLPRYYDRIITTEEAYQAVSRYIKNNPAKWHQTKSPS